MPIDENTLKLASQYRQKVSESISRTEKFAMPLCDEQTLLAKLLGAYSAMVESRDVEFQADEATLSKIERVVKWMTASSKRGLLLCGTLGNGKTTMLRALKILLGSRAQYMEAQAIYDYYKQNQSLPVVPADCVLLIDDLGVEPSSYNDFGESRYPLAEMLMLRYKYNTTTVVATNCTFEQIGETYGDRVLDRMKEMYAFIRYVEPSYRK